MVELLVTDKWQSMKDIYHKQQELGIKDTKDVRKFRKAVERYNALYDGHKHDKYVVHKNGKGYKFASSTSEIKASVGDLSKRAITMFKAVNRTRKAIGLAQIDVLDLGDENGRVCEDTQVSDEVAVVSSRGDDSSLVALTA